MSNRRRLSKPLGGRRYPGATEPHPPRPTKTYWNGTSANCVRGTATVADAPRVPDYWAREAGIVGNRVAVVEVHYAGNVMHLYDYANEAWNKVTVGRGAPHWRHRQLAIEEGSFRAN